MDEQYPVVLADMPTTIKSYVCKLGDYISIVINARLTQEQQRNCYQHEVEHIHRGDFTACSCADWIEIRAHGIGGTYGTV